MNNQQNSSNSAYNFGSDQNNSITSQTTCPIPQACGSRLPCGLCLITNQRCPMLPCQPNIVWTSQSQSQSINGDIHLPNTVTGGTIMQTTLESSEK